MERRYRLTSEQNDEIKNREGHRMQYDGPTLEPEQNLNGIELISASLPHAYLSRSNLDDACFEDADLSNADLSHSSLRNADFYAADLEDADLSFANLENACLTNANLTNTDLHGASFLKAELTGTDFTGAEITPETDFNGAFYYSLPPKGIDANQLQAMGVIELSNDETDVSEHEHTKQTSSEMPSQLFEPIQLSNQLQLEDWQNDAVNSWLECTPRQGPRHGIFSIFTGAGKTLLAVSAMANVSQEDNSFRFAIVVPTRALAEQWMKVLPQFTNIRPIDIGMYDKDSKASFIDFRIIVFVLASARKVDREKPAFEHACNGFRTMLIVDECHKAGATGSAKIFKAKNEFRLGLSATPNRNEVDENGLPLPLEKQLHGRAIGPICYELDFQRGIKRGLLPNYEIHHHGIELNKEEQNTYEWHNTNVRDAESKLEQNNGTVSKYLNYIQRLNWPPGIRKAAIDLQQAYLTRKNFLYKASERIRITKKLLTEAWSDSPAEYAWRDKTSPSGAIAFNERISHEEESGNEEYSAFGASFLFSEIQNLCASGDLPFNSEHIAIEHSQLRDSDRLEAVEGLKSGDVKILCTVKALQEGINVPNVGMGISVASTSSALQRIQTLGRILRAKRDSKGIRENPDLAPTKMLHLIYVANTQDQRIYEEKDWNLETGVDRNHWWHWGIGDEEPTRQPSHVPTLFSEEEAWDEIKSLDLPQPWKGPTAGLNLSYRGDTICLKEDKQIEATKPKKIIRILEENRISDQPKGRFLVTPQFFVVIKWGPAPEDPNNSIPWALGKLKKLPKLSSTKTDSVPDALESESMPIPPMHAESQSAVPTKSDYWYVLLQKACLAAAEGDKPTTQLAAKLLNTRRAKPAVAAAQTAANILAGATTIPQVAESPPATMIDQYPQYVAAAFVNGREDLLQKAKHSWEPTTSNEKDRRVAMLRCIQILLKETNSIYFPEAL